MPQHPGPSTSHGEEGGRPAGAAVLDHRAAADYVLRRQTPAGGFCFYRTPQWGVEEPNAPDTLAALASLLLLGVEPPAPEATGQWLRHLQNDEGGYPSLTIGWAALRGLELLGSAPLRSPRTWLAGWAQRLLTTRRAVPQDMRAAIQGLLRLAELLALDPDQSTEVAHLLAVSAESRGGWARPGADVETTALAVQLARRAGEIPVDSRAVGRFLRGCEDSAVGIRVRPDSHATTVGALWGGLVIAAALEMPPRWPAAIAASLVLLQRPNGGLGARHGAVATLRDTWRGLCAEHLLRHDPRRPNEGTAFPQLERASETPGPPLGAPRSTLSTRPAPPRAHRR